jgi:hypothetical protein
MKTKNFYLPGIGICLMLLVCLGCTSESITDTSADLHYVAAKANSLNFNASLKGRNEVPAVDSKGTGQAHMRLNKEETELSFKVTVANLDNVTQAHIHMAPAGVNGFPVAFLFGPDPDPSAQNGVLAEGVITEADLIGPLTGNFAGLVEALRAGNIYVNVHTSANPGGEIRGQLK